MRRRRGYGAAAAALAGEPLAAADNAFGARLFKQLTEDQRLTNIGISPFSAATVEALNFAGLHAVDIINAWSNDKTQRKIRRIADGMIDSVN